MLISPAQSFRIFTATRQLYAGGRRYPQKFLRQARFSRGFLMLLRFFKNPKMIKLMHLRSLLGCDLADHAKGGLNK